MTKNPLVIPLIGFFTLFLGGFVPLYSYEGKRIEKNREQFERKLEQSLENIAFSNTYFEATSAMDFLIDHPFRSLNPLRSLLSNPEIADNNLINIWNILHYILDDQNKPALSCSEIRNILSVQKSKQRFTSQVVDRYLDQCHFLQKILLGWMRDPSVIKYQPAFNIIQKHKLTSMGKDILKEILFSHNPLKQEMGLSSILILQTPNLPITPLVSLFSSPNSTLRYKVAQIFSLYNNHMDLLIKHYEATSSDLEKASMIYAFMRNSSNQVYDFMIKTYLKDPGSSKEISQFFLAQTTDSSRLQKLLSLLEGKNDESKILNLLGTFSLMFPHLTKATDLFMIRSTLQKLIPQEEGLVFTTMEKILNQIASTLRKNFSIKD